MKKENIKITYVPIEKLIELEINPRSWSEKETKDLKESLKRFDCLDPLIVNNAPNRENIVLGGNFRLKVARDLGFKELPVVYISISDPKLEKELSLRLNRNTGSWDMSILKEFDIDMLLDTGFDDNDLKGIWDNLIGVEDDNFDVDEAINEIVIPKTQTGDLYQLGMHRLICSDSTDPKTVLRLVGNDRMDMLNFDSPYNINLSYDRGISTKGKYHGQVDDNKKDPEFKEFLKTVLKNGLSVAAPDVHLFHFCDERYIGLIQEIFGELGIKNERVCLWIKNNINMTPQCSFNKIYEACPYGKIGKPYLSDTVKNLTEILNKEIATGNRTIDDLLDMINIWLVKRLPANQYEHPTSKPPELYEKSLRRCSKPGDKILELYGGSGSLLIACENMKRKCYMAEFSPVFCDVIVKRYEALTGNKAKLILNGEE